MAKSKKPSLGPHKGTAQNPIGSFTAAYSFILNNPGKIYTSKGGKKFKAVATLSQKGPRKGWKVIKFKTENSEGRAYKQCWGHVTNYSGDHIDVYTEHIF